MATYLTLIKFTEHGVKDIKDTCKRAADFKAHAKKHGIEVKEQYWCMGAYDGVIVFDDRMTRQRPQPCSHWVHEKMSPHRLSAPLTLPRRAKSLEKSRDADRFPLLPENRTGRRLGTADAVCGCASSRRLAAVERAKSRRGLERNWHTGNLSR